MKVELDNIRLAHSPLSDKVYVGVLAASNGKKQPLWKHKLDVTNDFISAVIARWEDHTETIGSGDSKWEISVKKIK